MTVLMSGVNMFAMAEVMKIVLGWDLNFSIIVSSLAVAAYVALGGLRSAIFNEVLQFVLIWGGALLVPILGLIEPAAGAASRRDGPKHRHRRVPAGDYTHMWRSMGHFADNPMGIHWTGIVFGLGFAISFGYWTTDFPRGAARAGGQQPALGAHGAGDRLVLQDGRSVHRHSSRPAGPGRSDQIPMAA
jgi:SSS family solute:Na+ symporter